MKRGVDRIFGLGFRALLCACLLVLVQSPLQPSTARAEDLFGLQAAATEARGALREMTGALNHAPRDVQITISADLHLMGQAITRALDRLEAGTASIADPTLVYDLDFLADIAHAATDELEAIAAEPGADLDPDRAQRIDRLTEAAAARLTEVNLVLDGWGERNRNAVVELHDDGGLLVVRSTDRLIYDGIRYVSIALLAVGLLAVGLQLLRPGQERVDARARPRSSPLRSGLAGAALAVFFAGCATFSLRPGTLAGLSAEVHVQAQEHPCERLAAQRDRLIAAEQADHAGLIEATKERMYGAAQDCLGLPSEALTAEAIERLAAKTALAYGEPAAARWRPVGLTAAAPAPTDLEREAPPEVAELEPEETEASADLAALLASIRESEEAPATEPAGPDGPRAAPAEPAAQTVAPPPAEPVEPAVEPVAPAAGPEPAIALEVPPDPDPSGQAPEPKPELFVTTTALNYREGPSVDARRLGTLVPGARLRIIGQDDAGWAAVRLSDGRQAYVASEFLEPAR